MIKIILIATFFLLGMIFSLLIMMIGFKQNEIELVYIFGLGTPVWFYFFIEYLKLLNEITIKDEFIIVKNLIFGRKKIQYEDIKSWKENPAPVNKVLRRTLILKTYKDRGKIIILEDIDHKKFEILLIKLKSDWESKEVVYKFSWL